MVPVGCTCAVCSLLCTTCTRSLERRTAGCVLFVTCYLLYPCTAVHIHMRTRHSLLCVDSIV